VASHIVVDDSLFSGPTISPDWLPEDVPSSYGSAITATMTDGGRAAPSDAIRSASPDLAAGHELAAALGKPTLAVTLGHAPASVPPGTHAASVASAPLSVLVEQMLHESDNVIADVLARQVAVARHLPASFLGAAQAVRAVLAGLGVDVGGGMRDGSGLAAGDRVSPASLAAVLRLAAGDPPRPAGAPSVRQASTLIAALPVAGWSGTLASRYTSGPTAAAAGEVRAKTGSLDGVTTLAGYVHDDSGRLLIFSFAADRTPLGGTTAAEQAIDRVVAALAACGCR
jgi:D-alanyl-D-alanine carboxypeptidase/D-alanyl-D-alanine-endopeptidase (penicillin-binding protein 4)